MEITIHTNKNEFHLTIKLAIRLKMGAMIHLVPSLSCTRDVEILRRTLPSIYDTISSVAFDLQARAESTETATRLAHYKCFSIRHHHVGGVNLTIAIYLKTFQPTKKKQKNKAILCERRVTRADYTDMHIYARPA